MKKFLCLTLLAVCFESNASSYAVIGPDPDIPGANRVISLPGGRGGHMTWTDVDGRTHARSADGTEILRDHDGQEYTISAFLGTLPDEGTFRKSIGDLRKMEHPDTLVKGLGLEIKLSSPDFTPIEFKLDPSKLKLIVKEAVPTEEAEAAATGGGDAAATEKDTSKES